VAATGWAGGCYFVVPGIKSNSLRICSSTLFFIFLKVFSGNMWNYYSAGSFGHGSGQLALGDGQTETEGTIHDKA